MPLLAAILLFTLSLLNGTPRLTGSRRYLFADPNDAAAIVVAFLEGQGQAPVLESTEGWRTDGTEWKVRLDYKVQEFDPKGAVTKVLVRAQRPSAEKGAVKARVSLGFPSN